LRFKSKEAISFIREAGGIPVLAHPKTVATNGSSSFEKILRELLEEGLRGIEVFYPEHTPSEVAQFKAMAERYGLLMTGGTDYHGIEKEALDIGVGRGEMKLPYAIVEALKAARTLSL
jgi:predicted metal-dependent phosphoesterase TrpH